MFRRHVALLVAGFLFLSSAAHASPPPIEAYGRLPAIEQVRLSPDGDRYAFIAVVGETRRLIVATTDNKPLLFMDVGTAKVRELDWAGEDYVLVTHTATVNLGPEFAVSKHELEAVVVLNLRTKTGLSVFERQKDDVATAVFGQYGSARIDGRWYGYFGGITYARGVGGSNYLEHTYPDLYRVDLETGEIRLASRGQENSDGWLVAPSGEVIARSMYDEKTGNWQVLAGRSGKQLAAGHSAFGGVGALSRGRGADTILLVRPDGDEGDLYQELSLTGAAAATAPESATIASTLSDPVTGQWIGEVLEGDSREARFFAPDMQKKWTAAAKAFPGYIVRLDSWSADFNRMIVFTSGQDDSGTYWFVDIAKRSAVPLGGEYPDVKGADVASVRTIEWKAADGLPLRGVLTTPPGAGGKNLALIVLPHGGPEARDYLGFDWWAQAFASRGYAVFQPNFRGSSGYGVKFRDAGFGQWGRKMQTDVSDGVAELTRQGVIDPKRVCIVGGSYGGYAALAGVTVQHGLYRCAAAVAGVADLGAMLSYERDLGGYSSSSMRYWKEFMGVTSGGEGPLRAISPEALVAQADAPILLVHGKDDTVVPIDQSRSMERALKRAGKPVDLVVMPSEDHWLSRQETRTSMLRAALEFVQRFNPPDSAGGPTSGATASAGR